MEQVMIQCLMPAYRPLLLIADHWLSWHGIAVLMAITLGFAVFRYYLLSDQRSMDRHLGDISISPDKSRR